MIDTVIKKDGSKEPFNIEKCLEACRLAAWNCSDKLDNSDEIGIANNIKSKINMNASFNEVSTELVHNWCISALNMVGKRNVASAYKNFHQWRKNEIREQFEIYKKAEALKFTGDRENANYNSALFSTQSAIYRGWHSQLASKKFYLNKNLRDAITKGFLYVHDLKDIMFGNHNCCVFNMEKVLEGGFKINGVRTKEPKRVVSCCGCMYDILNTASSQQFGGFSVPEVDAIIAKYAMKEFAHTGYKDGVKENIRQGLQSLQHHINSNISAKGDTPFISFSFGCIDGDDELFNEFQLCACLELLKYRQEVEMAFPKLICLYSRSVMDKYPILEDECIKTNAKTLYPDYVSLDAGSTGYLYHQYGLKHTPMGCRSFPTPVGGWDNPVETVGIANVGVISLNLPLIYKECETKKLDLYEETEKYLDMCIEYLDGRYEQVASMLCSSNPLAFCEGGMFGGTKRPNEPVGDIADNFGASIGITAINELCLLMNGVVLHEMNHEQNEKLVEYLMSIRDYVDSRCSSTRHYSLYGTPAESLCGTQCEQYKKRFGADHICSKGYFTNSFHMPVDADISPYEKQSREYFMFNIVNGGHIQYVRVDEPSNLKAIKSIVRRGMLMGFYQGINVNCISCEDCGEHFRKNPYKCPECGSNNILEVGRVCGYKGFMNRMNDAKLKEISERVSM